MKKLQKLKNVKKEKEKNNKIYIFFSKTLFKK